MGVVNLIILMINDILIFVKQEEKVVVDFKIFTIFILEEIINNI